MLWRKVLWVAWLWNQDLWRGWRSASQRKKVNVKKLLGFRCFDCGAWSSGRLGILPILLVVSEPLTNFTWKMKNIFRDSKNSPLVDYCSFRGPLSGFQHLHGAAHNFLQLQLQEDLMSLAPIPSGYLPCVHIRHTHTLLDVYMQKHKLIYLKRHTYKEQINSWLWFWASSHCGLPPKICSCSVWFCLSVCLPSAKNNGLHHYTWLLAVLTRYLWHYIFISATYLMSWLR